MALEVLATLFLASGDVGQVVFVERNVNLRPTPSFEHPPIIKLTPPEEAALLDTVQVDGYYHVRTPEGLEGWVWTRNLDVDLTRGLEPGDEIREYDRDDWNHWTDAASDCQDARQEVLIRDANSTITFEEREDGRECRVASGLWVDPYGGDTIRDPGDLDIDHMVPLQNAHCSGGWRR